MVATRTGADDRGAAGGATPVPTAAEVASGGLGTTRDLTRFGASLINDILGDRVSGKQANPICRTANFMLRSVDLENRHNDGRPIPMV